MRVLDADHREHKIRLAGVDAPEKGQPYGQRSKQVLSDCAFNRRVLVEGEKIDRYGDWQGRF